MVVGTPESGLYEKLKGTPLNWGSPFLITFGKPLKVPVLEMRLHYFVKTSNCVGPSIVLPS